MIAIDTNILVYAARQESQHHRKALKLLTALAEGSEPWAIPWPCAYEFLRVVTHPRVFAPPSTLDEALGSLSQLFGSPSLTLLGEGPAHPRHLLSSIRAAAATGNLVHDAHIAALCLEHGVASIYTMDRDFIRFAPLKVVHPF